MSFFAERTRFLETSETSATLDRLDLRHEAIFGENADLVPGARVLDIASHDGRWSLAALTAGASSVVGIEGRQSLVDAANANLAAYDAPEGSYRFVAGDLFAVLAEESPQVDVVLLLGFLYHTLRYNELFHLISRCGAGHLIIDTVVDRGPRNVIRLADEGVGREGNAIADAYTFGDRVLTGKPTVTAVGTMVGAYGFEVERMSDWPGLLGRNPDAQGLGDYRTGKRVTFRCRAKDRSRG